MASRTMYCIYPGSKTISSSSRSLSPTRPSSICQPLPIHIPVQDTSLTRHFLVWALSRLGYLIIWTFPRPVHFLVLNLRYSRLGLWSGHFHGTKKPRRRHARPNLPWGHGYFLERIETRYQSLRFQDISEVGYGRDMAFVREHRRQTLLVSRSEEAPQAICSTWIIIYTWLFWQRHKSRC